MLPIALRPDGRRAVIVGGGSVAARKAESLLDAGFPIFVVAVQMSDAVRALVARRGGGCAERAYVSDDLDDAALVVAATDDDATNARVVADARAARILACDAIDAERGDFSMLATQRVGRLTVSVHSGSPAFSKRIAGELAQQLSVRHAAAAQALNRMRDYVKESFPPSERAAILRDLAQKPVDELASMTAGTVVCATRGSRLATIQTRRVAAALAQRGIASTMLVVTTAGDRVQDAPIAQLGVNVFVKELEQALRDRRADYAVHSCKDLPSELAADLRIAAISKREDPRDAFCSERFERFEALPPGSVVGTSSPRRRAQLVALRPDLVYVELRGNVDTRLRKLADGRYDAIVLAMAGLDRLGMRARFTEAFSPEAIVPAVGQGALAVETRAGDNTVARELFAAVNDAESELCVRCERAALRELRAGCSAPIGIYARVENDTLVVHAAYADGTSLRRERASAPASDAAGAERLGRQLAERLQGVRATP
jgi:hydroxymethylbilane synthase